MELLYSYIDNLWEIMLDLSVWLLLGMIIAGLLHILLPAGFIRKHLGKKRFSSVVKAVAIGVPMPLCSCGVIPVALGLKKDGASNGASTGFLISTPQTGVDSILVCAGFLGLPFAIFKVISAFISGLVGGFLANLIDHNPTGTETNQAGTTDINSTNTIAAASAHCSCHNNDCHTVNKNNTNSDAYKGISNGNGNDNTKCIQSCCEESTDSPVDRSWKEIFRFGIGKLLADIYLWLVIGIAIAAAITTFIPAGSLSKLSWTQGILGMFTMLAISLPMYICATSSVPLAASLIIAGMSPGSALVFLMAGPASNIATMGAILRAFGGAVLAIYLGTVMSLSIIFGLLFDWLLHDVNASSYMQHSHSVINTVAAVVLTLLLVAFIVVDLRKKITNTKIA